MASSRERYARAMRGAAYVVHYGREAGASTPEEAIDAYHEALRDGKVPEEVASRPEESPLRGRKTAARDHAQFKRWAREVAALVEGSNLPPEEVMDEIRKEMGDMDPDLDRSHAADEQDDFREWISKVVREAIRAGLDGDETTEAIAEARRGRGHDDRG